MKSKLLILILMISMSAVGQKEGKSIFKDNDVKLSVLPYYNFGKGIGITSPDSIFQLNIRFRMQNRVTYYDSEEENPSYDGQIRRLRLRFDGYVGNPKFLYAVQLSFAPGDVGEVREGENINIIRDAVVYYRPNSSWNFSFGQTKLPGNRQRINSSGGLQLTDRSINNSKFTLDRDFGFQVHQLNEYANRFSYNFKAALTTGEGRNVTGNSDDGVAVTGKAEVFPLGAFKKDGTNFEGDILFEEKPKLMLSAAFQQNNMARRTQGQLGEDLFQPKTLRGYFADAMLKYNGWAAMAAYMSRSTSESAIALNPEDPTEFNYAFTGSGFDYQLSYTFRSHYEVIGRYSLQKVHRDIQMYEPDTKQYSIGLTKYIWEHTFKLQTELTYDKQDFFDGSTRNSWYVRFQVEIGI